MKYLPLIALLFVIIILSGCTNSQSQTAGIPTPTPQIVYITVLVTPTPTIPYTFQTTIPTSKKPTSSPTTMKPFPQSTYEIGESASNGLIKVTVNSKRYADKIPSIGPGGVQEYVLSSRGQWEIVKVTVENIQQDGNVSANWNQFLFMDNREGTHTGPPSVESPDKFYVNLAPSQKVTGELAFQVTKNPIGVQLRYTNSGQSVTFNV